MKSWEPFPEDLGSGPAPIHDVNSIQTGGLPARVLLFDTIWHFCPLCCVAKTGGLPARVLLFDWGHPH
ncbi:MAG: hypothetical protein RBT80_02370 [Candidatus Vecturithrix sp.]|nr:hypothetical protein [Candidatus Vecturithrix sp.]